MSNKVPVVIVGVRPLNLGVRRHMQDIAEFLVDVNGVDTTKALHELLASRLGFPDYYGRNWDAFNDCVSCDIPQSALIVIMWSCPVSVDTWLS